LNRTADAFYADSIMQLQLATNRLQKQTRVFSLLRLLSFLLMVGSVYLFAISRHSWALALALLFGVAMVFLVIRHQELFKTLSYKNMKLKLFENELSVLHWKSSRFDNGAGFSAKLPFGDDLDLFGQNSLFHYLNRCTTGFGRKQLADSLVSTKPVYKNITDHQAAIRQMGKETRFNFDTMTKLGLVYEKPGFMEMKLRSGVPKYFFSTQLFYWAAFVFPAVFFLSLFAGIITGNYSLLMVSGALNMLLAFSQAKKVTLLGEEVSGQKQSFECYAEVLRDFSDLSIRGVVLEKIQGNAMQASRQFVRLSAVAEWFDWRNNMVLFALGNMSFLSDIHIARAYEKWKKTNTPHINEWLEMVGEIEVLISFGQFGFNNDGYVFPAMSEDENIRATALGHPLIPASQRIVNKAELVQDARVQLVTGSNMSGKSTYLRTLGVNVILAQAGAPVCATSFCWKPCLVLSSLRQSDSLHENTSLFLHELKQIQWILEKASASEHSLILLDEVLRGTNSADKYTGTLALLKKLSTLNALTVVATHDLKLSELESDSPDKYINYCFESQIVDGRLVFDYTIRKGVAVNRNATWLMKEMGIIG